jgi:hypothetical protein
MKLQSSSDIFDLNEFMERFQINELHLYMCVSEARITRKPTTWNTTSLFPTYALEFRNILVQVKVVYQFENVPHCITE